MKRITNITKQTIVIGRTYTLAPGEHIDIDEIWITSELKRSIGANIRMNSVVVVDVTQEPVVEENVETEEQPKEEHKPKQTRKRTSTKSK